MLKVIDSFRGEYRFLSNFFVCSVHAIWNNDHVAVDTVEHAFQAAKAMNRKDFDEICAALTPGDAKRLGRKVIMRSAWDAVKMGIMENLLREKFDNKVFAARLLDTGEAELIEGNTWGDVFWGVCDKKGENHLGKLLMKIRGELRQKS